MDGENFNFLWEKWNGWIFSWSIDPYVNMLKDSFSSFFSYFFLVYYLRRQCIVWLEPWTKKQRKSDLFFHVSRGRLKLRTFFFTFFTHDQAKERVRSSTEWRVDPRSHWPATVEESAWKHWPYYSATTHPRGVETCTLSEISKLEYREGL